MKLPAIIILSSLGLGIILTLPDGISGVDTPTHTPVAAARPPHVSSFLPIDYPRLYQMAYLLKNPTSPNNKEYQKLCLQATSKPQIGMTIDQSRNTTWCFPYTRHITTTVHGEMAQEVYLRPDYNGNSDSRYSHRQYLYFDNNILTTIQE